VWVRLPPSASRPWPSPPRAAPTPARQDRDPGKNVGVKVGVLTGGGDCPGLNAVIRAVARRSFSRASDVIGIREGWRGLVEGKFEPLGPREISGLLPRGGTILGTSRTNPYKIDRGVEAVLENFRREGLDALVAIGGEDTLGVATRLYEEHGFPVVGVPKTSVAM
jgi:6-phosphofructokinase